MPTPTTQTELLKTHDKELVKDHIEYDVQGRTEYIYTASANAINGSACLVTRYSYSGITSNVVFNKEYYGIWNSAWELF